jgi:FixJ family two-component response regulator
MAAESIEWHEQCLANQITHHHNVVDQLKQLTERERSLRDEIVRYHTQIIKAKQKKKKSFDKDKFMKGSGQ